MLEILVWVIGMAGLLLFAVFMVAFALDQDEVVVFMLIMMFGMPFIAACMAGLSFWALW